MVHIPSSVPNKLRSDVREVLEDRELFMRLLRIEHKTTHAFIPFTPNDAQTRFLDLVDNHSRVVVVKARQVGITTAARAQQLKTAYCTSSAHKYALISFHDRSAKHLRRIDKKWLQGLPKLLQRKLSLDNATDFEFADTQAGLSAYTAGSRGGTRSFSFSAAHLSEFAFYNDPDETLAQVEATVGKGGNIIIESTVNAPGDAYHRIVENSAHNGWALFTYWWWQYPDYRENVPHGFKPTKEEEELIGLYNLDWEQLSWRRHIVHTLGLEKFRREYPACLDDCFLSRKGTFFDSAVLDTIDVIDYDFNTASNGLQIEKPNPADRYVIGADPGGGVGGDYSAFVVVSCGTMQPVYTFRDNKISPRDFAHRLVQVGSKYNDALILVEGNNHGHAVILELNNCQYRHLWLNAESGKAWTTTAQSKIDAYNTLRDAIPLIRVMDRATLMELKALSIPPGKVTPEAPNGLHDDCAISIALAYRALRDVPSSWRMTPALTAQMRVKDIMAATRAGRLRARGLPF